MAEDKKPESTAWTTLVALGTTILAVCAAFSSLKGGSYSTQTQLATVNASNKWSHYQSKSIKESGARHEAALANVLLANAATPAGRDAASKAAVKGAAEAERYGAEKAAIQKEAESLEALAKYCQKRGANFGMAIMFLQIAIMLSAIATLLKKKRAWLLGMAFGLAGIGYLVYAWPAYEYFNGTVPVATVSAK